MSVPINKRLLACASLVRDGAVLADVGTDHGYLPIHLLQNGRATRAVLSDINEGPLRKAEKNVREAGLLGKVSLYLCDGAKALSSLGITDYCIAGMGGELIASIISSAPQMRNGDVRLILQPMSKPEALRTYLYESGFDIEKELYVKDEGKYYVCIQAVYVGERVVFCAPDAHFGKACFFESGMSPDMIGYMMEKKTALCRMIEGKRIGGADTERDEALLSALLERLDKNSAKGFDL